MGSVPPGQTLAVANRYTSAGSSWLFVFIRTDAQVYTAYGPKNHGVLLSMPFPADFCYWLQARPFPDQRDRTDVSSKKKHLRMPSATSYTL